jgi:hypothetical protein
MVSPCSHASTDQRGLDEDGEQTFGLEHRRIAVQVSRQFSSRSTLLDSRNEITAAVTFDNPDAVVAVTS